MVSTLYLTRNGLLEPLGQSQVLSYLRGLSREHRITLITYEKPDDWADGDAIARVRAECQIRGIRWLPQRFRYRPRYIAPALSMVQMTWLVWREVKRQDVRLIHARSYIPAAVAYVINRLARVPFIFDMRALWPEELIAAGRLRRGSLLHRTLVEAEKVCLYRADGVVSLTNVAVEHLQRSFPNAMAGKTCAVIPTCADLERFVPASSPPGNPVIGCLGTLLSGWFRLDWLAAFLQVAARRDPALKFQVTTRDDAATVRRAIGGGPVLRSRLEIVPVPSDLVPEVLRGQIASVMFFTDDLSKLGSCPTRLAEVLACGLPVVANEGVGDMAGIIRNYRVGVIARGPAETDMEEAYDQLKDLLSDPALAIRCRRAAEGVFSLEAGTNAYLQLYAQVLEGARV